MKDKRMPVFFVLILFSLAGLWQFSKEVRSVDVVGLYASGVLLGAAITSLIMTRNK